MPGWMKWGGLKPAWIPRLERTLTNGLLPTASQQWGQPCSDQFCDPYESTSYQLPWPGQGHRLHANKFGDDIILGVWDSMPNGRASIRRAFLGLTLGQNTLHEVQQKCKDLHLRQKNPMPSSSPAESSRHLQWVPGCKGANSVFSHWQRMWKSHYPRLG